MTRSRRFLALLALLPGLLLFDAAPAAGVDDTDERHEDSAVAVNTEDGASVFRLAFSVRRVANGVVDQSNEAYALASCTDCQTVALAFQVVLVQGDADVVVPENRAVAFNSQCVECVTYASATQIVLGFDGPVRFTAEGRRRLAALQQSLRQLEDRASSLTLSELNAAVQAAKAELIAILDQELVEGGSRPDDPAVAEGEGGDPGTSTTTTTGPAGDSPTTTSNGATGTTAATATSTTATTTSASSGSSSTTTTTDGTSSTTTTSPTTSTTVAP